MKKFAFLFVAMIAMTFASCGNGSKCDAVATEVDSLTVASDSLVETVDSLVEAVDSVVAE